MGTPSTHWHYFPSCATCIYLSNNPLHLNNADATDDVIKFDDVYLFFPISHRNYSNTEIAFTQTLCFAGNFQQHLVNVLWLMPKINQRSYHIRNMIFHVFYVLALWIWYHHSAKNLPSMSSLIAFNGVTYRLTWLVVTWW